METQKTVDKINNFIKKFLEKLGKFSVKLAMILVGYSFMTWIFLGLYDRFGFDKTLIILLVGVLWYGLRSN